ncbi:hypothetical protein ON010_g329 [Phytophthora cinnamomi]|nr:hypothetical protein ON010_g329 [Phytophthora cinnamomi]
MHVLSGCAERCVPREGPGRGAALGGRGRLRRQGLLAQHQAAQRRAVARVRAAALPARGGGGLPAEDAVRHEGRAQGAEISFLAPSVARMLKNAECASKSEFSVLIDVKHDESADEVRQIPAIKRGRGSAVVVRRRSFDGFGAVSRALAALSSMPDTIKSPPARLTTEPSAVVTFERDSVYMQGRYLKFQRGLSQTPWVLDGERMGESSVEECIGDIALPFFRGSGYKFHTAGREDVDVRMLGNGRPFILEILGKEQLNAGFDSYQHLTPILLFADAKKAYLDQSEYDQIQKAVNDANNGAVEIVNAYADDCLPRTASCVVWSEGVLTPELVAKIDVIQDLTIQQQTPIRVLHRRTLMTRPKIIHAAKCEVLNKHYMLLRLTTSAGTYVKEFVHGDRGRTNPNVASILLDVESLIDAQ